MNMSTWLAGLLGLAIVVAWLRLGLWQRSALPTSRSRAWRVAMLVLLQPVCAALLYFTLLPPSLPTEAGTLVIATANATLADAQSAGDRLIALPEAPALPAAERAPDLATALRRYPGMQRLRILGAGLEPRDREAARAIPLAFDAPALPRGLVRLDAPPRTVAGDLFRIGGQVNGVSTGSVELIDPAGRRVDAFPLSEKGDFVLSGTARLPGWATFNVRVRDAQRKLLEEVPLPVWTAADAAPRVWLLAGAASPELKYLRRWAADAGIALHTQLNVGGGLQLGDAALPMTAATLQRFDLVVLDERSWAALSAGERAVLIDALRRGLGVLLRVSAALPDATRRQWQALGFATSAGADTVAVPLSADAIDEEALRARRGLDTQDTAAASTTPQDEIPALNRRALNLGGTDTAPLLRDAAGNLIAVWRAEQLGRIALWSVTDSFALVLSGQGARHAELWSDAFATLARPRTGSAPRIDPQARAQQRVTLCELSGKSRVSAPGGPSTELLPDPSIGDSICAGYWPQQSGWHLLRQIDAQGNQSVWPFFVYAADAAVGLRSAELRDATLRLQAAPPSASATHSRQDAPARRGPSWPWFLAWLASVGLLWWLERARVGRTSVAT